MNKKPSEFFKNLEGFAFTDLLNTELPKTESFHRHTLFQIARLINIQIAQRSDMIHQHLQGD